MPISMKGIADAKPPQLPQPGKHEVRITSAERKKSRNSDSTYINLALSILDDDEAQMVFERLFDPAPSLEAFIERKQDDSRPEEQAKVADQETAEASYQAHKDALIRSQKTALEVFNVPYEENGDGTLEFDVKDFEGQEAEIRIRHVEDNRGETQAQVRYPRNPPKDGAHQLKVLSANLGKAQSGSEFVNLRISVEDDKEADQLFERIYLPAPDLETFVERKQNDTRENEQAKVADDATARDSYKKHYDFLALQMKRALHAFDVPYTDEGFDENNFVEKVATLETRTSYDDSGEPQTEIIYPEVAV